MGVFLRVLCVKVSVRVVCVFDRESVRVSVCVCVCETEYVCKL